MSPDHWSYHPPAGHSMTTGRHPIAPFRCLIDCQNPQFTTDFESIDAFQLFLFEAYLLASTNFALLLPLDH